MEELAFLHEASNVRTLLGPDLIGQEPATKLAESTTRGFRNKAACLYASLRAAGRMKEAREVHAEACRLDPSDEMRLALEGAPIQYN